MSVRQGDELTRLIEDTKRNWNAAFDGGPIAVTDDRLPEVTFDGGLTVTILAPHAAWLERLGAHWERERRKMEDRGTDVRGARPSKGDSVSGAGSAVPPAGSEADDTLDEPPSDTTETGRWEPGRPIRAGDVEKIAAAPFREDTSVPNGASIALLLDFGGQRILVAGDSYAYDLAESIRTHLQHTSAPRLRLDAFVVSHNGSRNNATDELLQMLDCSTYLFSTNGAQFRHPDPETVAKILMRGRGDPDQELTLVFNYRSETTEQWESDELQAELNFRTVFPVSDDGVRVDLTPDDPGSAS